MIVHIRLATWLGVIAAAWLSSAVAVNAQNSRAGYYYVAMNGKYGWVHGPYKTMALARQEAAKSKASGSEITWGPDYSATGRIPSEGGNASKRRELYRIEYLELDKRWDHVAQRWNHYYRSAGTSENEDPARLRRAGDGWVEGDRRTIVVQGVRMPYRKYTGPVKVTR